MVIFERKVKAQANINAKESSLDNLDSMKVVAKKELRRISISEINQPVPDFKNSTATKDSLVAQYLSDFITNAISNGDAEVGNLLPTKKELSNRLGVSMGTVQNAIRHIEDQGYVESKQRIGTMICNRDAKSDDLRKQTSKREIAIVAIKKYILNNGVQAGEALPSSRDLAKAIGSAPNTTRLALENLSSTGVIDSKGTRGNKANWILREVPMITHEDKAIDKDEVDTDTLVDQVERDLKELIKNEYNVNDKLPAHFELSELLKVSIKTVHDAMKRLSEQGIIRPKRGRYGTSILRMPSAGQFFPKQESSIFATAVEASMYNYEKVERHLKSMIKNEYKVGDKLPAMGKLSEDLNVSSNTIRKALQQLADDNVVSFTRGRYGGTFITNIPEVKGNNNNYFTWLSVNPQHIAAYRSN